MRKQRPSRRGKAIRRLRLERGWTKEQLGAPHGLSGKVMNNLEQGWRQEPSRQEAEELLATLELPPVALDVAEAFGQWVEAAAPPPHPVSPEEEDARRSLVAAGLYGLHVARRVFPALLRAVQEERFARDREQAEERCQFLRRLPTPQARRERITEAEDYQTWALVERLAHESVRAAADDPAKAKEWAELALFTVPFVPGSAARRRRLEAYATFFLANALRVGNDLVGSDAAFQKGWALLEAGEDDGSLPLELWRARDLEASLRREQRRFQEALDRLSEACETSPEQSIGRILLKKAATLEQMGDVEASIEALQQARPYVEAAGDPRDLFGLRFNLALAHWHLGQLDSAEALLPRVRDAALLLANRLDLSRTLWLEARIDLSLGRVERAAVSLEQVFEDLLVSHRLPYDAALVGMDLAVLHLEQSHTQEVMSLALRMETVFTVLGIEREALAAVLVFCEAARREEATVGLARQTAEIIKKVQHGQSPSRRQPGLGELERGAGD
jgi:tetratricopeptide (TPR) repeat protein